MTDDAAMSYMLKEIDNGNYEYLYDLNINTFGKSPSELKQMFMISKIIHSKFSAIAQFSNGMSSIRKKLGSPSSYNKIRVFLEYRDTVITFNLMVFLFSYSQLSELEEGSNQLQQVRKSITEFEMFLAEVDSKEVAINDEELMTFEKLFFFLYRCGSNSALWI